MCHLYPYNNVKLLRKFFFTLILLYNSYTQFPRIVRLISSANHDFSTLIVTFLILRLINTLAYLFTEDFLVDNVYDSFINNTCKLKFLLKGLAENASF